MTIKITYKHAATSRQTSKQILGLFCYEFKQEVAIDYSKNIWCMKQSLNLLHNLSTYQSLCNLWFFAGNGKEDMHLSTDTNSACVTLTDWESDWLTNWLTDWLTKRLTDWLTKRLTDWLTKRLTDWLTDQETDWLTDQETNWLTDWPRDWLTD